MFKESKLVDLFDGLNMSLLPNGTTELTKETMQLSTEAVQDAFQKCVDRAKVYVEEEKWESAIAQYRKAIELRPKQTWIYLSLGSLLDGCGARKETGKR